jgi:hypothetical protein
VTLYYEKAWWSKEEQSWVNEGFHILDHVQIRDQERQRRAAKRDIEQAGKSSFVWNEVVFNSFKAGYLKQIDFEFYKNLESAVSKRMYRFLDKRFYHRERLEFDLRTFACEHIGLSKNYHNGELKRVLTSGIVELERCGFIATASPEERFIRKARGEWGIVFTKASKATAIKHETSGLAQDLIDRGISAGSARKLVAAHPEETTREKIQLFDWLRSKKDPRVQKNPAGFLYRSITDDFSLPDDYRAATAPKPKAPQARRAAAVAAVQSTPVNPSPAVNTDRLKIDEFWQTLPADEQEQIEAELVKTAPPFLRQQYIEGQKGRGLLFQTVRQAIIDDYVRSKLPCTHQVP